nr:tetratricopeptide repeat protein [Saprospiraceae bacterium]
LEWADLAINNPFFGQSNFTTLSAKGNVLMAMGKADEAKAIYKSAIDLPDAGVFQVHQLGRIMIGQGEHDLALEIFEKNMEKHPNTWPVDFGMARAYSAKGEYKKALKHAKIAVERAPNEPNKNVLLGFIEQLKKGEDIN